MLSLPDLSLSLSGANQSVPLPSFLQVELSLQSSFQPGMKLEVANKSSPDTYWVATIITTCGQLLLLRYSGYGDDRRADFWCDVMTAELHPVGWCTHNDKTLIPPEGREGPPPPHPHTTWPSATNQNTDAGFEGGARSCCNNNYLLFRAVPIRY